ncbi:Kinesin-like protein, partial [Drosera capensis]
IHADETKSTLQFASRALRVTNCACVNEILTDAALLKRQKKEIEELREKLQVSSRLIEDRTLCFHTGMLPIIKEGFLDSLQAFHSEHLEDQILSLRNTLLQTELEKERIALELEEEKKAKSQRERRLQEQEKKIENMSTMVLYSNRDEAQVNQKKDKRRGTWCPSNINRDAVRETFCAVEAKTPAAGSMRVQRKFGPLLLFEELVCQSGGGTNAGFKQEGTHDNVAEQRLPDPSALLNITSRKKGPPKKKSLPVESYEVVKLRADNEDLRQRFESQRVAYETEIDYLRRKLEVVNLDDNGHSTQLASSNTVHDDKGLSSSEMGDIAVTKQHPQSVMESELEKASSGLNVNNVVGLATEHDTCTSKYAELYNELLTAKEEARVAQEQLASKETVLAMEESFSELMIELSREVQQTMDEVLGLRSSSDDILTFASELLQSYTSDFKSIAHESSEQLNSIIVGYEKLNNSLKSSVMGVESEKAVLQNECSGLHQDIEEMNLNAENSEKALTALNEQFDLEKAELLYQIQILEKKVLSLSSSTLFREKESLRKDLEKTRTKLKETESKLKNTIQDKTRIESEKANAEREIKKLHSQKAFLVHDFSRRESIAGGPHSTTFDRSIRENDSQQGLQGDYKNLEVLAFEMEATIATLEEQLATVNQENEELVAKAEVLSAEITVLSDKLDTSNSELTMYQDENLYLKSKLEQSEKSYQEIEGRLNLLVEEKIAIAQ